MIFHQTPLPGAYLIEPERRTDARGFFARIWDQEEFAAHDLNARLVQGSIAFNDRRGTLRGMHYQLRPRAEAKLIRCTQGAIYDVIIDLRPDSPAFRQHVAAVLSAANRLMHYAPEGCAHGYLTMEDGCEVVYQMSEVYAPDYARGVRWDDPAFAVPWPFTPLVLLERDASYPDFAP